MCNQWDQAKKAFRCAYTGLPLTTDKDTDGHAGPMFATWEHIDPRSTAGLREEPGSSREARSVDLSAVR